MLAWCWCISLDHITGFPEAAVAGILLRMSRMLCRGTKAYKSSTASCGLAENGFVFVCDRREGLGKCGQRPLDVGAVEGSWHQVFKAVHGNESQT